MQTRTGMSGMPPHTADQDGHGDGNSASVPFGEVTTPSFRRRLSPRGRACHALVARLPDPLRAPDVRRRLDAAAQRWPALGRPRLWETSLPTAPGAPASRDRRHRELLRPVPEGHGPLRAVLLRYADGTADLVLVALRRGIPRTVLEQVADLVLSGSVTADGPSSAEDGPLPAEQGGAPHPDLTSAAWDAPDWGLGDADHEGVVSARPLHLPRLATRARKLLPAAVALTLVRYCGEQTAGIGYVDADTGPEEAALLTVDVDEDGSRADLLARADAASPVPAGPHLPPVGVLMSTAADDRTYVPCLAPVFPLTLHAAERPDGTLDASYWFDEGAVSPRVAEMFCASVARLTAQLAGAAGAAALAELPVLTAEESAEVLRLGGAGLGLGAGERIDERFEEMARRRPDAVALVGEDGELTYRQLDERADGVAAGLRALGVAPGSKVGVCLDRDTSLVVALLGVLKAGCAYVPMDFRYPPDRMRYITESARLPLVIGDSEGFPAVADVRVAGLDELVSAGSDANGTQSSKGSKGSSGSRGSKEDAPAPRGTAADAAYVIFTSGSTGRPKGVVVPHRNVLSLLEATSTDFALGPDDVWTLFHSSAFDFSVWEIWGCLLTGGRLVVVPYWTARDTDEFRRLLAEQRVTVLNQTPSAFTQLVRADRDAKGELAVRLLVFGGEPLDVGVLAPWFARHSPTLCRAVNMFGITETTVHVTAQPITPAELVAGSRSVGRALPGWSVSVRDARGRVLPPGAAGEIHVGGAGVADGYLGQPELTAQRFVTDALTGERLYRSGDKGRLRPDGRLDHLGRLDNQVKIRGHRIELDEIRSVLAGDPAVSAAVVITREATPGDPASSRIDAYVVLDHPTGLDGILDNTRRILPDYMVPATLTEIPSIPLTPNGKPDPARLPAPTAVQAPRSGARPRTDGGPAGQSPPPESAPAAPAASGAVAEQILETWSRCLGAEVTEDDNFFELGGNSLLVVRVLTALREQGLPKVPLRAFYANSTARAFIGLVERLHQAAAPASASTTEA